MSKLDKIIAKILNSGSTITFQELEYLLKKLGYIEKKTGKTSGSRKAYVNAKSKHVIRIHKPHSGSELKKYVKLYVVNELKRQNLI